MVATVAKGKVSSLRSRVGPEEWQTRLDLAACYRLIAHHRWDAGTGNHLSARVPGEPDHILLNPFGLFFDEITASSLVKVDSNGKKLTETPYRLNHAAFNIHSAVYRARPDVMAVLHTHSEGGMAISALKSGLVTITQTAAIFHNRVAYHDFRGPGDTMDDCEQLGVDLGPHYAMILRNHGLLISGRSVAEAFSIMFNLESAIAAQLRAQATGGELIVPPNDLCEMAAQKREAKNKTLSDESWIAWVRLADRIDRSYRK